MRDEQSLYLIQRGGCEGDQKPPLVCGSQSTALSRDERGGGIRNGFKISLGATGCIPMRCSLQAQAA